MIIRFHRTPKIAQAYLISRRIWLEIAVWRTDKSALKGWQLHRTACGLRVITPLIGAAYCVSFGAS